MANWNANARKALTMLFNSVSTTAQETIKPFKNVSKAIQPFVDITFRQAVSQLVLKHMGPAAEGHHIQGAIMRIETSLLGYPVCESDLEIFKMFAEFANKFNILNLLGAPDKPPLEIRSLVIARLFSISHDNFRSDRAKLNVTLNPPADLEACKAVWLEGAVRERKFDISLAESNQSIDGQVSNAKRSIAQISSTSLETVPAATAAPSVMQLQAEIALLKQQLAQPPVPAAPRATDVSAYQAQYRGGGAGGGGGGWGPYSSGGRGYPPRYDYADTYDRRPPLFSDQPIREGRGRGTGGGRSLAGGGRGSPYVMQREAGGRFGDEGRSNQGRGNQGRGNEGRSYPRFEHSHEQWPQQNQRRRVSAVYRNDDGSHTEEYGDEYSNIDEYGYEYDGEQQCAGVEASPPPLPWQPPPPGGPAPG